jgi:hypothetical protein
VRASAVASIRYGPRRKIRKVLVVSAMVRPKLAF